MFQAKDILRLEVVINSSHNFPNKGLFTPGGQTIIPLGYITDNTANDVGGAHMSLHHQQHLLGCLWVYKYFSFTTMLE